MKSTLIILAAICAFSMSSCKKDYTCTCVTTYTDTSFLGLSFDIEQSYAVKEKNESKAKSTCDSKGSTQQADYQSEFGSGTVTNCDVKKK